MNKHLHTLTIFLLFLFPAFGQHQADNWHFGRNAALSFATNPISQKISAMVAPEGSAIASTPKGDLLFYTNGQIVYTREHVPMPNGTNLKGNPDATQSSVVVPRPGHKNKYFIFTLDDLGGRDGLTYSEVDMTLNRGFGDVTATKNVYVYGPVTEKLTAVRHSNGTDYWVLVHQTNSENFLAYKVTAKGPEGTAIISTVGSEHNGAASTLGYLKFSPNGKKAACAVKGSANFVEIFDFDDSTGKLSNPLHLDFINSPYGIEFSPDSRRIYVTAGSQLFQYTLPKSTNSSLLALTEYSYTSDATLWGVQLGPDHKLYIAKSGNKIDVVNLPCNDGVNIAFDDNALTLDNQAIQGLPNFYQNLLVDNFIFSENNCQNQPTRFGVYLNGLDSIHWDFGDGQYSTTTSLRPSYTYKNAGTYLVKATIFDNGYTETFTKNITIIALPAFSLGRDTNLCKGQSLRFDFSVPNASYLWNNGSTANKRMIASPGLYTLEVSADGCKLKDSLVVKYDNLNPDFTINKPSQCFEGNKFTFTGDAANKSQHKWLVNGVEEATLAGFQKSFQAVGNYSIKHVVISSIGCTDTLVKEVSVLNTPKAGFVTTAINNCGNSNKFIFSPAHWALADNTYEFEIENRSYINQPSVEWSFSKPGEYTVTLLVRSKLGCEAKETQKVIVYPGPDATFKITAQKVCITDNSFSFEKNTPLLPFEKLTWWVDGVEKTTPTQNTFYYSFNQIGKHTIEAKVSNTSGCIATYTKEVEVFMFPTVDFTTSQKKLTCLGNLPIQLENLTTDNNTIVEYKWDFGNNTTSSQKNPVITYANPGSYTVSLTAFNDKGCAFMHSKTINTYEKPDLQIATKVISQCVSDNKHTISFTNNNAKSQVSNFVWASSNGLPIAAQNPTVASFASAGNYSVSVIATTSSGCADTATTTLFVYPEPTVEVLVNNDKQCLGANKFEFSTSLGSSTRSIKDFLWNFDNGITSTSPTASVNYNREGDYTVTLNVTDEIGCKTSVAKKVAVYPTPAFGLPTLKGCNGEPISFKVNNLSNLVWITDWNWDFGDGSSATDAKPSHTYPHAGKYNLTVTATTDKGCTYTLNKPNAVEVFNIPAVDFTYTKTYWKFEETELSFKADVNEPVASYTWDFENGKTSGKPNEKVLFDKSGYYRVSLKVQSPQGCIGKVVKDILIVPPFDAYLPTSFTPNGDGKNDVFGMEGVEFINTYHMEIFNRWGQKLFETHNLQEKWNGKLQNEPLPPDMYLFNITITDAENRPYELQGTIQLIR